MKYLFLFLFLINTLSFSGDLEKSLYEPKNLNENDFFGTWNFYSNMNENNKNTFYDQTQKTQIEIHFNKNFDVTISGSNFLKKYLVYNNKLSIGTTVANVGLNEQELYKIVKIYKTDSDFCYFMTGISSPFTTESFSGIMCKKYNLKHNLYEQETKK